MTKFYPKEFLLQIGAGLIASAGWSALRDLLGIEFGVSAWLIQTAVVAAVAWRYNEVYPVYRWIP